MTSHKSFGPKVLAAGAAAGVALLLAACGASSSSHAAKPAASPKPAGSKTSGLTLSTAKGSMGTYLVGASGRALYMWVADHNGKSACSGACAQNWPPLTSTSAPKVAGGASASDVGTVLRSGGAKQVTYKGHPLYYYIGDSGPGMTSGEGSDGFGARWWLLSPSGTALTSGSSASGSSSTSSSSSGGY